MNPFTSRTPRKLNANNLRITKGQKWRAPTKDRHLLNRERNGEQNFAKEGV